MKILLILLCLGTYNYSEVNATDIKVFDNNRWICHDFNLNDCHDITEYSENQKIIRNVTIGTIVVLGGAQAILVVSMIAIILSKFYIND